MLSKNYMNYGNFICLLNLFNPLSESQVILRPPFNKTEYNNVGKEKL